MLEPVTLYTQEPCVEPMEHPTTIHLSTMATVLSLPVAFLIMMLKMMLWFQTQTPDVKGGLYVKENVMLSVIIF